MKLRIAAVLAVLVLLASLFFPFLGVHPHMNLDSALSMQFPASISGVTLILQGAQALPTQAMPALAAIDFRGMVLALGVLISAAAAVLSCFDRKGARHVALGLSVLGFLLLLSEVFYLNSLSSSTLFTILLDMLAFPYVAAGASAVIVLVCVLRMRGAQPLCTSDARYRLLAGVLSLVSCAMLALPFMQSSVTPSIVADASDAARLSRSINGFDIISDSEPSLSDIAREEGAFTDVLSGDLGELVPLSADATNIAGAFKITTRNPSGDMLLLIASVCLLLAGVFFLIRRVDRWIPTCLCCLGAALLAMSVISMLLIGSTHSFYGATKQLMALGLGHVTLVPVLMLFAGLGAALCGVLCIHFADAPYFINPIPGAWHMRACALALGVAAAVMLLLPSYTLSLYKSGRTRVAATVTVTGVESITFTEPQGLENPVDNRGNSLYDEEPEEGQYTAAQAQATLGSIARTRSIFALLVLALTLAGVISLVISRVNKRVGVALFLLAAVLQAVSWFVLGLSMPKALGTADPSAFYLISMGVLVFAGFFAAFKNESALPKKYKLFLMLLPFLVAVFLFSYMPLYGWSYAFYNYKFGFPMSEQEFVGFKWFTEMFVNSGHRANLVRVMQNTFGMSGLNILTSWMPMAFAIFLSEIGSQRFKKFVQIFTTLPNFISWALVFSFAQVLFSLDTGIVNKMALQMGLINEPVAWLNSNSHIWVKMWAWNTWKGLGWGAIMYLAAIAGIDQELYEAANVDGAGRFAKIRYITIPGLLPTFFVLLLLSISNIINNGMEQYLVFQNSMNKESIEVLDLYVYNITIASKGTTLYSFGTAIGILKTIFSVTLLFLANAASKKLRGESIV